MSVVRVLRPFGSRSVMSDSSALQVTLAGTHDLQLRYRATGFADLVCPAREASPGRRDGLWQHTCAELFVADPEGTGYLEFNFSPSGAWAAYAFDAPRRGQRDHRWQPRGQRVESGDEASSAPRIEATWTASAFELQVALPWDALRRDEADRHRAVRRVGITFVAARASGLEYWALDHPAAQPDFHHPGGFVASLEISPC